MNAKSKYYNINMDMQCSYYIYCFSMFDLYVLWISYNLHRDFVFPVKLFIDVLVINPATIGRCAG